MHVATRCPECHARYTSPDDSCMARFERLLALDHARREPWGSRHGQAFAAFALQHPERHAASLDAAWVALYRIFFLGDAPRPVFAALRRAQGHTAGDAEVPERPRHPARPPDVTIADLGDFGEADYPARLDDWCRATLRAWGVDVDGAAGA